MFIRPARYALFAATGLGAAAAILVGLFGLQSGRADAQGIMSAPACQCSVPTAIARGSIPMGSEEVETWVLNWVSAYPSSVAFW